MFSLLYKHVKMFLELVSIIMDCIWPGKLDVDAEKLDRSGVLSKIISCYYDSNFEICIIIRVCYGGILHLCSF